MDKELPFVKDDVNKANEASKETAKMEVAVESDELQTNSESSISQTEQLENVKTDTIAINDVHKQTEIQKVIPKISKQVDNSLVQKAISNKNIPDENLIKDLNPNDQELQKNTQSIKDATCEIMKSSQITPKPELYKTLLTTPELIDTSILENDGTGRVATTTQISPEQNLIVSLSYNSEVNPTLKNIHMNGISTPANITSTVSCISPEFIQDSLLVPVNNISTHVINDPLYNARTILGGIDNTLNNTSTGKTDTTISLPMVLNCSLSSNNIESNIIEDNSSIDLQEDVALNISHSPKTYIIKEKETAKGNCGDFIEGNDKILLAMDPIETNPGLDLKTELSVDEKMNLNRRHSFMTPAQRKYMQDDERNNHLEFSKPLPPSRISSIHSSHEHITMMEFSEDSRHLIDTTKVPQSGMINLSSISDPIPIPVNKYELISNDLISNDIPLQLSPHVTPDSFAVNYTTPNALLPNLSQVSDALTFDSNIHTVNDIERKSHSELIYHTPVEYMQPEIHQKWISYVDPLAIVSPAPSDLDEQILNSSRAEQTSLPLKKRRKLSAFQPSQEIKIKSFAQGQNDDISYPSTPMMSIAEVKLLQSIEELQEVGKRTVFKTPGQLKFIPVPSTQHDVS